MFDFREIKKLNDILSDSGVGEIEIRTDEVKLKLSMGEEKSVSAPMSAAPVVPTLTPSDSASLELSEPYNELTSRWVGFFTRFNPKTKEYYVKLRDEVKKDDLVGHVRVLGVLQDIKAGVDGKVKEILVEEGQPIEYGQPIMRFEV